MGVQRYRNGCAACGKNAGKCQPKAYGKAESGQTDLARSLDLRRDSTGFYVLLQNYYNRLSHMIDLFPGNDNVNV